MLSYLKYNCRATVEAQCYGIYRFINYLCRLGLLRQPFLTQGPQTPILLYISTDKTDAFTLSQERDFPFLKTECSVLRYQPPCYNCFHLSIIYGLVVAKNFVPALGADDSKLATNYPGIIIINIGCLVTKLCVVRTYFLTDYLNSAQYFVYEIIE